MHVHNRQEIVRCELLRLDEHLQTFERERAVRQVQQRVVRLLGFRDEDHDGNSAARRANYDGRAVRQLHRAQKVRPVGDELDHAPCIGKLFEGLFECRDLLKAARPTTDGDGLEVRRHGRSAIGDPSRDVLHFPFAPQRRERRKVQRAGWR